LNGARQCGKWLTRASATVEENKIKRKDADEKIAAAEPIAAMAQIELQQIEEERARMERGEGLRISALPRPSLSTRA